MYNFVAWTPMAHTNINSARWINFFAVEMLQLKKKANTECKYFFSAMFALAIIFLCVVQRILRCVFANLCRYVGIFGYCIWYLLPTRSITVNDFFEIVSLGTMDF